MSSLVGHAVVLQDETGLTIAIGICIAVMHEAIHIDTGDGDGWFAFTSDRSIVHIKKECPKCQGEPPSQDDDIFPDWYKAEMTPYEPPRNGHKRS